MLLGAAVLTVSACTGGSGIDPFRSLAKAIADYIYGCIHPCCTFPLSDLTGEVPPVRK